MGLGRRKVDIGDESAWVFNRMADVYDARPPYPSSLIDAIGACMPRNGARVVDLGAGIGHVAVPLATRGYDVVAVEPAIAMLARLRERAEAAGTRIEALHAKAEAVPLADESADLVIIADALHFVDAELTGLEVRRLLKPDGALVVLQCAFADTPFMNALTREMEEAAPRRPRDTRGSLAQLGGLAGVTFEAPQAFVDANELDAAQLERIVQTISFIGPAMNEARFSRFVARIRALPEPIWGRAFTMSCGRRSAPA